MTTQMRKVSCQLTSDTLPMYLKDRIFVEYFNSFLMLPAFTSKIFFNVDTHNFEPVQNLPDCPRAEGRDIGQGQAKETRASTHGLMFASASMETLYLTDDALGPALDPRESWLWVIQHRLPLFIKSDLFAEYKLSQILLNSCSRFIKRYLHNVRSSMMSELDTTDRSHRERRKRSAMSGRRLRRSGVFAFSAVQRSPSARPRSGIVVDRLDEEEERVMMLCSKSGMGMFQRFLEDKPGEKNWLFWMDAEQTKHLESLQENQHLTRHLLVMQQRYLRPGATLELSSVLRTGSSRTDGGGLNPDLVYKIQSDVENGLKTYWYPRFLLHYLSSKSAVKVKTTCSYPMFPSITLPTLNERPGFSDQHLEQGKTVRHPSKSATPTFRRFQFSNQQRQMQRSHTTSHTCVQPSRPSTCPSAPTHVPMATSSVKARIRTSGPLITPAFHIAEPSDTIGSVGVEDIAGRSKQYSASGSVTGTPVSTSTSRLLWSRRSALGEDQRETKGGVEDVIIERSSSSSAEHFTKLAKYRKYPVIVSGRPTTVHGSTSFSLSSTVSLPHTSCSSRCQILSVSGTPVHPADTQHYGGRMDQYLPLLRCLTIEHRKAGGYFQKYLETLPEKVYLRCLMMWRDIQDYKDLFVGDGFNPSVVEMKAKVIYGCYIVVGGLSYISCPSSISKAISNDLWPAFEDLFDTAEEYVLGQLLGRWEKLCEIEQHRFEKIQYATDLSKSLVTVEEELSDLYEEVYFGSSDSFSKYFLSSSPSSSSSLTHTESTTSIPSHITSQTSLQVHVVEDCEGDRQGLAEEKSERTANVVSMADILKSQRELEHFKVFLNDNMAAIDLLCWMDIESFRALPVGDKVLRNMKAKHLKATYFNKNYFFGPNSPASKEAWRQVITAGGSQKLTKRPGTPFFREAQKHIRARLEKKWVPMFISSPAYVNRSNDRMDSATKTKDRKLDNNLFTASRDMILLRKMLHDRRSRDVFQKYITVRAAEGTHPSKNMDFWLEVHRFKEMFHSQMNVALLQKKLNAIVSCYLTPSKIEIDVPFNEAETVTKKPFGPYVFREPQATVFKLLLGYWQEFQSFAGDRTEQEIVSTINQLDMEIKAERNAFKQEELKLKREEEERRLSVMRFETEVERKVRLAQEKEKKEFGEVSVEFRLSSPKPQFSYCGRLADLFHSSSSSTISIGSDLSSPDINKHDENDGKSKKQLDPPIPTVQMQEFPGCNMTKQSAFPKHASGDKRTHAKSSPDIPVRPPQLHRHENFQVRFRSPTLHSMAETSSQYKSDSRKYSLHTKKQSVFFYS